MPSTSTTVRDRDRRIIARTKPPCGICGGEIDWAARSPHPDSFVVDHIIPTSRGGLDVIENKRAAHWSCNRQKSDKLDFELLPAPDPEPEWVTSRRWW